MKTSYLLSPLRPSLFAATLCVFLSVVSLQAQFTYITNNGAITITGYTGSGGDVTIPSATNGYPVTTIGTNAFYNQTNVTGVIIPNSVTNIGTFAFHLCYSLTNVMIPNSVTTIGDGSFFACYRLPSVTIPDSVTGIGLGAFENCAGLTNLTIGNNVTSISNIAFWGCSGLMSVTIPNSVASIADRAFGGCSSLTNIVVNAANPNYASNGGVLFNKTLATLVQCPGGLAGSYAIPESVISIGSWAFSDCFGLTNVTIPNSVTNIGNSAFDACGLTSVTIGSSVTSIGNRVFAECSGLTNIAVNAANPSFAGSGGVLFNKALTTLIQYPGGLAGSYLVRTGNYVIPDSVTNIGDYAFGFCFGLTNVTIPNSVISIGNDAFSHCIGLTDVTIPNSVTGIGNSAFEACGFRSVTIGGSVTSIGDGAFVECSGVTNIAVNAANPSYASADGVLFNKTLTTLVEYPGGLAGSYVIPSSVTSIGNVAFYWCSSLTSATIPNSVTSIGNLAFVGCSGLTNLTIGDSVTNIGHYAFVACSSLHQAYFQGNAPGIDSTVFGPESGTVYYLPGTTGWSSTFGGWPTALWYQPKPVILGNGDGLGVQSNQFGFTISWATNLSVVIEASTNLVNPIWTPVATNALINGTNYFSDAQWTNYPQRYYRIRSP